MRAELLGGMMRLVVSGGGSLWVNPYEILHIADYNVFGGGEPPPGPIICEIMLRENRQVIYLRGSARQVAKLRADAIALYRKRHALIRRKRGGKKA